MDILKESEFIFRCRYNKFARDKVFQNLDQASLERLDDLTDSMLQACFQYGQEHGKQEILNNIRMMEEDECDYDKYVTVGVRVQKESESQTIINNLHPGENIIEFKDRMTARKKFDSLRKFAKNNGIPLRMKQQGNLVYLKKV